MRKPKKVSLFFSFRATLEFFIVPNPLFTCPKLLEMKNEKKNYLGLLIPKKLQILWDYFIKYKPVISEESQVINFEDTLKWFLGNVSLTQNQNFFLLPTYEKIYVEDKMLLIVIVLSGQLFQNFKSQFLDTNWKWKWVD